MDDQIDSRLLERFLAGDCTDEERELVVRWVDGIPERQALLHALRTAWTRLGTPPGRYDAAAAWGAVAAKLEHPARRPAPNDVRPLAADAGGRASRSPLRAIRASAPRSAWRVAATIL